MSYRLMKHRDLRGDLPPLAWRAVAIADSGGRAPRAQDGAAVPERVCGVGRVGR